jgi:hypothetical protein
MAIEIPHRFYMAFMAIVIFILGIFIGNYVVDNVVIVSIEAILIGLAFTSIILILIIGSLIVEIKSILESKKKR